MAYENAPATVVVMSGGIVEFIFLTVTRFMRKAVVALKKRIMNNNPDKVSVTDQG